MNCFRLFLILIFFSSFSENLLSQAWLKGIEESKKASEQSITFYDIQNSFNSYWADKEVVKGKGWKQFKRWENFMEPRIYPEGSLVLPDLWTQWKETLKNSNANSSSWSALGPFTVPEKLSGEGKAGMGRLNSIAFHPSNQDIIYVGSPSGGLWKTTNGGLNWTTSTDNLMSIGISDIAIDPKNPNLIYVATGDGDAGDTYAVGILKSFDAGHSWNQTKAKMEQSALLYYRRIIINPENTNILLASSNKGIYRTVDGFATFSIVKTGNFKDLEFKPGDPSVVYATQYSPSGDAKVFKSIDGGLSFSESMIGLNTDENVNRIELALSPANPNYIYALCSNASNDGFFGLFKSVDAGAKWTRIYASSKKNLLGYSTTGKDVGGQGWYDLAMAVNPESISQVFVGGINIYKSVDGGSEFNLNTYWIGGGVETYVHADQHMLAFNPLNKYLYACNDGGLYLSKDNGDNWTDISNGLNILQIYRISASSISEDFFLTGNQDNGSYRNIDGTWEEINGADGMECWIDPTNDSILYTSIYYGSLYKSIDKGNTFTYITPPDSWKADWVAPFIISERNPEHLFAGYSDVFKSYDRGESWHQVSFGLAKTTQLRSLAVAPMDEDFIYAATYDRLFVTKNGGTNWKEVSAGLPAKAITSITVSPNDPSKVWITHSGYQGGKKVSYSEDGANTWTNYSDGLPNVPANTLIYQKYSNQILYLGTDIGVFFRNAQMSVWESYNKNLPNVIINDFDIQYNQKRLIAGTYGRGLWTSPLSDADIPPLYAEIIAPARYICVNDNYEFSARISSAFDSIVWSFPDNLPSLTKTINEPVSVKFTIIGQKTIDLSIYKSGEVFKTRIKGFPEVINTPEIEIVAYDTSKYYRGSTATLMTLGASKYTWDDSPYISILDENIVKINAPVTTEFFVTGSAGSCSARKSILLNVIRGPDNDDVCSAIFLESGKNGPFKNVYASVEKHEPLPDTSDCNTQLSWCNQEGGLQSTVWFKYTAGGSVVSFSSEGFDTQIALYESPSCENIIEGNYTIIAANDDFYGESDNYAAAIVKADVSAGKTYFLQVDGSAGGEVGEFYITVLDNALDISKNITENNIKIFPNPGNGELQIRVPDAPSNLTIQVFDSQGKTIQTNFYNNPIPGQFEEYLTLPHKGIFLMRIIGKDIHHVEKVLIE